MLYFSKSTRGFYESEIHGENMPVDVVEITEDQHADLLKAQSQGQAITSDANGNPITVDPSSLLSIAQAQEQQTAKVSAACAAALVAGFTSSALGISCTYGSNDNDQRNLFNAALAAQGQPSTWTTQLWCASSGTWSLAMHTAAQVQQVNADWLAFRMSQQQKCANLIGKITAATTVAAVQAISWRIRSGDRQERQALQLAALPSLGRSQAKDECNLRRNRLAS